MSASGALRGGRPVGTVDMVTLSDEPAAVEQALLVLGVRPDASLEEAGQAYRRLIRACHPDLFHRSALEQAQATQEAARVNAAWAVVRPAAEALARHRLAISQAIRLRRETAGPSTSRATAQVIRAEAVHERRPCVIPVPDASALQRGAA